MPQKHTKTLFFSLFLFAFHHACAQYQVPQGIGLETTLGFGRIVRHSPKFIAAVKGYTSIAELNLVQQTNGSAAWHHVHKLPSFGLALHYADFGDPEVFGNAIGLLPNIAFGNRAACKKWYSYIRIGIGLAYLNRPYNPLTNVTNTVIGQNINNITDIRFGFGRWLSPNVEILLNGSFTHWSDAAAQLPNLGINVPALSVGLRYTPRPIAAFQNAEIEAIKRHWQGFVQFDYGAHEQIVEGGPKYYFASSSFGAFYNFSAQHHFFGGLTYEYSENAERWSRYQFPYLSENEYLDRASRVAVFVGDEFRFGDFAFGLALGTYIKESVLTPYFLYEKVSARYYFLPRAAVHPFVGVQLKAHLSAAEYAAFGLGCLF